MKRIFLVFLLVQILTADFSAQTRPPRAPRVAVLKPAIVQAPPKKLDDKKIGVTIERYVSNYDVKADGSALHVLETLRRLSTPVAIKLFGTIEIIFNADLQNIEILEAYTLDSTGKQTPVASDDITIKPTPQAEAAPAFSSLKVAKIVFPDVKIGDAIFYKLRFTENKPIFAGHFSAIEILPAIFEWKGAEINLTAPADYQLFVEAVDLDGGKLPNSGDGKTHYQWRKQTIAAQSYEPALTSFIDFSPRLVVSNFNSYEELGATYWEEAEKKAVVTPAVQKLADEITANINEPQAQAYAIYEWANKNIRYLSIVLGRGGWIPHSTNEILAHGYGDCKDYTTLLNALLAAKKIDSYPVLIRAEDNQWFPSVAAPDFFNHEILYIPSLDLFADATAPNTRLGLLPQALIGKTAFLGGTRTGIIKVPAGKPEGAQFLSDVDVSFAQDGSLKSSSKNSYAGRAEMLFRPLFADSPIMQNSEVLMSYILAMYGVNATGKIVKISNPHRVGEPFGIETEINYADYTTFLPKGSLTIPLALTLHNLLDLGKLTTTEERKTNLTFGAMIFRENYKLNFPASVKIEAVPPLLEFANEVGRYRREFKLEANVVSMSREVTFKKDVITPSDYPALREIVHKIAEDFNVQIDYTADKSLLKQKSLSLRKQQPKLAPTVESVLANVFERKPLKPAQVAQLEAKLRQMPNDLETRQQLLRHYNDDSGAASARANNPAAAARFRHELWFVQNHPEIPQTDLFLSGSNSYKAESSEYQILRAEWLKQIAAKKTDAQIRLNALEFINCTIEAKVCEKILSEGEAFFTDDYRFALKLFELNQPDLSEAREVPGAVIIRAEIKKTDKPLPEVLAQGERALLLLKKERSSVRDEERADLLPKLAKIAFKIGEFGKAKLYADELVLEFGDAVSSRSYAKATHIGNIILGRIAFKENDLTRAKEYLLIAARAPQRAKNNFLKPEMSLAEELFAHGGEGVKDAVAEYLKLCENFKYIETKVLERWQTEIKAGKTPSFNVGEL